MIHLFRMPSVTLPQYYSVQNGHTPPQRRQEHKESLRPSAFDSLKGNSSFFNISQGRGFVEQERAYRGQALR
jgi:hypothetical protein